VSITLFCPAKIAMKSIKKKWTLEILFSLNQEFLTFTSLKSKLDEISDKVLSDRLRELIDIDLIKKTIISRSETKYDLTERGRNINAVLYELSLLGLAILDKQSFESKELRQDLSQLFVTTT